MNPLIWKKGICDPHIHIFEGKAYLYATHDAPGYEDNFHMEDWEIWSSENLIDWQREAVVEPEDFYCGTLNQCWALDAAAGNGKYYLYFSTGDWGVGVGVSDRPQGPFADARGDALADYRTAPAGVPKWDPCVFVDDDGAAYLITGTCRYEKPWDCYWIGRLEPDMVHLAEPLRRIEYIENPCPEDKASVHKYNGRYYLTHSSYYAVADHVYGPYTYLGNTGCNIDHGSYFSWNNQTYFASGGMDNPNRYLRASFLAPCHYRQNGEIVVDQKIMEYGCGQYDAAWERILAVWFFGASRECKQETEEGEFVTELLAGEYLYFPEIANIEANTGFECLCETDTETDLVVCEDALDGPVLGRIRLEKGRHVNRGSLRCPAGKKNLYLMAQGHCLVHWFSFYNYKHRYTIQPVFAAVGRGCCLTWDPNASNHQLLKNLELKGAFLEALADGGKGGEGMLVVPYTCAGEAVSLSVAVNGQFQGRISFPVTGSRRLGKYPHSMRIPVTLKAGLNRIRLESGEEYQRGRLAIDHVVVESAPSCSRVYAAANGILEPMGNGCWDGFPQRESDPLAYSGRMVKFLEKPGDAVFLKDVEAGAGGNYLLTLHYCRGEAGASVYELFVNEKRERELALPSTGGYSAEAMAEYPVPIQLKPGNNTIRLVKGKQQDKGIYIDALALTQAGEHDRDE